MIQAPPPLATNDPKEDIFAHSSSEDEIELLGLLASPLAFSPDPLAVST